jgi:hypothetical protein
MDQIVTHAMMMDRGAAAFDKGLGIDHHDMNHGAAAIPWWQAGWRARQKEFASQFATALGASPVAAQQFAALVKVSPP